MVRATDKRVNARLMPPREEHSALFKFHAAVRPGYVHRSSSHLSCLQPALDRLSQFMDSHGVIGTVVVAGDGMKIGVTYQVLIIA